MLKGLLPDSVRRFFKKMLDDKKYEQLLNVYKEIKDDPYDNATDQEALVRAASTVGLSKRDLLSYQDQERLRRTA